jgi:hypothetical protein
MLLIEIMFRYLKNYMKIIKTLRWENAKILSIEVLTTMKIKVMRFWNVMPCRLVGKYQRFSLKSKIRATVSVYEIYAATCQHLLVLSYI